ncbi:WecB/TagA/CpsF family glycosyltransferase [Acidipila sp. EB88]|uniref:WecB/TagA/CpsF family glycosyltransferase n=1 Tax=Acidipila sp. EB88 TaxID=2305226 RepID=UPI000F5E9BEA|nr:WecB/TagA/CpsF family glycosyltransferase [Acidipila sp. EB88]RRA49622.1 glycosyltransferase [Acidipila sp. EB88]
MQNTLSLDYKVETITHERDSTLPSSQQKCLDPSQELCKHAHADVLGIHVSAIDMRRALELSQRWIERGRPGYICVTGVHGVMEAQKDQKLRAILNHAIVNTPDGMPMTWVGRLQGFSEMDRVYGPGFMAEMCQMSVEKNYRHFFYGGQPGVAEELKASLMARFPGLQVVGTYTPPFRALNLYEEEALLAQLRSCRPHILWVGLSTPKQERFMAEYVDRLGVPLLVGVGAAFDYHTGRVRDCPEWVKRAGLQWCHRLAQDPRRLWRRYLTNNPAFLWKITRQLLKSQPTEHVL